jgi:hypothetical protein
MRANYGKPLRTWLKQQCIDEITDFGDLPVFENATTYPCIIRIKRAKPNSEFKAANIASLDFANLNEHVKEVSFPLKKTSLDDNGWAIVNQENQNLLEKLRKAGTPLGEYVKGEIYRGVLTGLDEAFIIDRRTKDEIISKHSESKLLIKPYLAGKDVGRYKVLNSDRYLIFMPKGWTDKNRKNQNAWEFLNDKYPVIANHLSLYEEKAKIRCDKGDYWWELRACDYYNEFEKPKMVYLKFQVKPAFTFDEANFYSNSATFIIPGNDKYLLGILNSKLGWFLVSKLCTQIQNGYQLIFKYFGNIPIPPAPSPDSLTPLVSKMLELHKKLSDAKIPEAQTMLQRQIEATDKEIDRLVYELYGLTEEEIKIVEGS